MTRLTGASARAVALALTCVLATASVAAAGADPSTTTTTTTEIELGPATSITRAPASPDFEVRGVQVVAKDRGPSWGWWFLLLLLPVVGLGVGLLRQRLLARPGGP